LSKDKPDLHQQCTVIENEIKKLEADQEKNLREKDKFSKKNEIVNVEKMIEIKNKEDELKQNIKNQMRKIMIQSMMAKKERIKLKDKAIKPEMDLDSILNMNSDLIKLY